MTGTSNNWRSRQQTGSVLLENRANDWQHMCLSRSDWGTDGPADWCASHSVQVWSAQDSWPGRPMPPPLVRQRRERGGKWYGGGRVKVTHTAVNSCWTPTARDPQWKCVRDLRLWTCLACPQTETRVTKVTVPAVEDGGRWRGGEGRGSYGLKACVQDILINKNLFKKQHWTVNKESED